MSLEGKASGRTLVGNINRCDLLTISAYGIAVKNGFKGTEEEWLESLKGASAQIYVGEGEMPPGYAVQIDPTGENPLDEIDVMIADAVEAYIKENDITGGGINEEELQEVVNAALAQAKVSGEFDGKDGIDGKDGYTPIKGVDYFDGAKGDKGDPGEKGEQGIQGIQGEKGDKGDKGDTGAPGTNGTNGKDGADGQPGADGKDGEPGQDGVSATHSWNGTVLTITSASGTSSADLKGEKGDKGDTGAPGTNGTNGKDGADGKTPVKGTDYYTEADKTEMVNRVISALPTWTGGSY